MRTNPLTLSRFTALILTLAVTLAACGATSRSTIEVIERGEGGIAGGCIGPDSPATLGGIFFRHDPTIPATEQIALIEAYALVEDSRLIEDIDGPMISDGATALTAQGPDEFGQFMMSSSPGEAVNEEIGLRMPSVDDDGRVLLEPGDGGYMHLSFTIQPSATAMRSLIAIYGWGITYEINNKLYRTVLPAGSQLWIDSQWPCSYGAPAAEDQRVTESIFQIQRENDYGDLDRVSVRPLGPAW